LYFSVKKDNVLKKQVKDRVENEHTAKVADVEKDKEPRKDDILEINKRDNFITPNGKLF